MAEFFVFNYFFQDLFLCYARGCFNYMHIFIAHRGPKRALAAEREPLSGRWELDPGPLKGEPVLFNGEP